MSTIASVAALPDDLAQLGPDGLRSAIVSRRALLEQVFAEAGPEHDMAAVRAISGTPAQKLAEVKRLNDEVEALVEFGSQPLPHPGHPRARRAATGGEFYNAIIRAGWDMVLRPRVTLPGGVGVFAGVTWSDAAGDIAPRRVAPSFLAADRRYLYPALPIVGMPVTATSVEYVKQSARSLASTSSMIRAVDATTTKPETSITLGIASAALKQVAHKVSRVPNIVARQRAFSQVIENDLQLGLNEAPDALVIAAIPAPGAGITMATAGSDRFESLRKAITVVEAAGYEPDTVALPPSFMEELDILGLTLENSIGADGYFGLRPRVCKSLSVPLVLDTRAFATLYAGPVEFASFEENDGASNSQLFRAEVNAIAIVDRPDAAAYVYAS